MEGGGEPSIGCICKNFPGYRRWGSSGRLGGWQSQTGTSYIYIYIWMIYCNNLQVLVLLIYQWLAVNGMFKNLVVAQSTRLGVSAGLLSVLESCRSRLQWQWRKGCASKMRASMQRANASFFYVVIQTSSRRYGTYWRCVFLPQGPDQRSESSCLKGLD